MTLFINLRSQAVGGAVIDPYVLEGDGTAQPPAVTSVAWSEVSRRASGKNVLMVAHGFNVSYQNGACSLGRLESLLKPTNSELYLGVLWPGDWWLPAVNYPFEGDVSMDCGRRLARFCNQWFADAASLSFASHSLGARLVLEAVKSLSRPAKTICLTAGAINRDCLDTQYAVAAANTLAANTLASTCDNVLKLAFPIGDAIGDALDDDHTAFTPALGYKGPARPIGADVRPSQIPVKAEYDHGDYLPPSGAAPMPAAGKWVEVANFIANSFRGQPQTWP